MLTSLLDEHAHQTIQMLMYLNSSCTPIYVFVDVVMNMYNLI
jgi:hypothetical protein